MEDNIDTAAEFPEEAKLFNKTGSVEGEIVDKVPEKSEPSKQAITIRDTEATSFLDPNLYTQMKALANDFIKSKSIPSVWQSSEQVLVGLQTGVEMGMKPMEAMNSLYPVNGSINVWGKATTRRLKEHGWTIQYSDESQETCTVTVTKGDESYTETFTYAEAEASGYTKDSRGQIKIGWKPGMNRRKKLRYGVLSLIIATYIPEVLGSAMGIVEVSEDYDFNKKLLKTGLDDDKEKKKQEMREKLNANN